MAIIGRNILDSGVLDFLADNLIASFIPYNSK